MSRESGWTVTQTVAAVAGLLVALVSLLVSIHLWGPEAVYGHCNLKPQPRATAERLSTYLKNGIRYGPKQADLAKAQFLELLRLDPNFVGANLNLGVVLLAQKRYAEAEQAFNRELELLDCLSSVDSVHLADFAYMLESPAWPWPGQRTRNYRTRIEHAQALAHYNLACVKIKQTDMDGATSELKLAAKSCLISQRNFETDPDFAKLREQEGAAFTRLVSCPKSSQ